MRYPSQFPLYCKDLHSSGVGLPVCNSSHNKVSLRITVLDEYEPTVPLLPKNDMRREDEADVLKFAILAMTF